jgi:hypothetical protein
MSISELLLLFVCIRQSLNSPCLSLSLSNAASDAALPSSSRAHSSRKGVAAACMMNKGEQIHRVHCAVFTSGLAVSWGTTGRQWTWRPNLAPLSCGPLPHVAEKLPCLSAPRVAAPPPVSPGVNPVPSYARNDPNGQWRVGFQPAGHTAGCVNRSSHHHQSLSPSTD